MPRPDPHQTGRLWIEEAEAHVGPVAVVAPVAPIDKQYTYAVPAELGERLTVGQRVRVRLGRRGRVVEGFCVELTRQAWEQALRPLDGLVDEESYLAPALLELGRWISRYYCCPLGPTLAAMVPKAVRKHSGFVTHRYARLSIPLNQIVTGGGRIGTRARALVEALEEDSSPVEVAALLERASASPATLRSAVSKGWVVVDVQRSPPPPPRLEVAREEPAFDLNPEQRAALEAIAPGIESGGFGVTLMFGVSGSGKTEVYVRAIRRALERDRQAILLVPEIALTTQLVGRLAARFDAVAVIHSGLSDAARSLYWQAIARGEVSVVIGTRSAVFAPCPRLGVIVIDEEQETSYKNLKAPRFHVRDVAIKRAQLAGVPVVLGSATPSMETWWNCQRLPHYRRVDLPRRVRDLPMPNVTLVKTDTLLESDHEPAALSDLLREKLSATLGRGEQAMLLINRRGFAWGLRCPRCGWRLACPRCNVTMVFHASRGQALCHYCGGQVAAPLKCPMVSCDGKPVRSGAGTQRVEQELQTLFPKARVARADSDSLRRAAQYQELVDRFAAREIDVLVGTQMIAKGLDFPFVSLVGVIGADLLVSPSDFRAAERLFQLVTQVAGRAGRGDAGGEVVVQSLTPELPVLKTAVAHDFPRFAEAELEIRCRAKMPPFSRLARFVLADPVERRVRQAAAEFAEELRARLSESSVKNVDVLGPQPCSLARLRDQYRFEALLRASTAGELQQALEDVRAHQLLKPKVKSFVIDVDPVALT